MKTLKSILEPTEHEDQVVSRAKEMKNAHELGMKLEDHYQYPENERKAVHSYTWKSTDLNGNLWDKHNRKVNGIQPTADDHEEDMRVHHSYRVKDLEAAMDRHRTPVDLNVYTKSRHDPRTLKDANDMVHHPAYMSTSLNRGIARKLKWNYKPDPNGKDYHHHIWNFHVPKGSKGIYADHISQVPSQKEFILDKGSNFKYHKTETQKLGQDIYHYHHMELKNENST